MITEWVMVVRENGEPRITGGEGMSPLDGAALLLDARDSIISGLGVAPGTGQGTTAANQVPAPTQDAPIGPNSVDPSGDGIVPGTPSYGLMMLALMNPAMADLRSKLVDIGVAELGNNATPNGG